jgi:6-pyruvoyltetrahydropterin/6-carboxytetrahydropterin synthase
MGWQLTKTIRFTAAHSLPGHPKCAVPHGHDYRATISASTEVLGDGCMVVDFHFFNTLREELDHANLNDLDEMPTVEWLCCWIANRVWKAAPHLIGIRVEVEEGFESVVHYSTTTAELRTNEVKATMR